MDSFWGLNLIKFLDFYLASIFLVSTGVRVRQYQTVLGLVRTAPSRWPRLFLLLKGHWGIFLTWATVAPALLALGLMLVQVLASRLIWPDAGRPPHGLTMARLMDHTLAIPFVALFGFTMLAVDLYCTFWFGKLDPGLLETSFDQAEFWLKPWTAPVVRFFTLGRIHPRQRVDEEVRKALVATSRLLNTTLWWVSLQMGLRIAFGLSLWLTYLFGALWKSS